MGGSMIGESFGDYMIGGGSNMDLRNICRQPSGSVLIPSFEPLSSETEHKKNQKLNAQLIRKALVNQPQTAICNKKKGGFNFNFNMNDIQEEKSENGSLVTPQPKTAKKTEKKFNFGEENK